MRPYCLLSVVLLVGLVPLAAQTNTFPTSGSAGIGTTSPSRLLSLYAQYPELILKSSASSGGTGSSTLYFGNSSSDSAGWLNYNHTDNYLAVRVNEGERMRINSSGNVGIGTTSPGSRLSVNGPIGVGPDEIPIQQTNFGYSSAYKVLRLGLDQSTRALALNVDPSTVSGGNFSGVGQILIGNKGMIAPNATGTDWMAVLRATAGKVYLGGTLSSGEIWGDGLVVSGGNVGIGTTSPSHKLSVYGTIRAKEVIVDTGWSDYVFADDYRLAPLSEVEAHIKSEKHLPGIPSASQVAQGGVSLGDMQAKLLAKVEELTLHVIAQEKRIGLLEQENYILRSKSSHP